MPGTNPRIVPRVSRQMDLGGIVLLLLGAACYLRAWLGMNQLRDDGMAAGTGRFAGLAAYDGYWELSRMGLGIAAVAIVILVASAVISWQASRATAPADATPATGPASL